jgi:hypothetical protein
MDEFPGGVRMYSPVTGPGSPLAPPMRVTPMDGGVMGRCLLGIAHEGPPGYGHGGFSAMLLDELMGWACAAVGKPGMTISAVPSTILVQADGIFVAPAPEAAPALLPALDNAE